jgi:chromosome segregation ATPase
MSTVPSEKHTDRILAENSKIFFRITSLANEAEDAGRDTAEMSKEEVAELKATSVRIEKEAYGLEQYIEALRTTMEGDEAEIRRLEGEVRHLEDEVGRLNIVVACLQARIRQLASLASRASAPPRLERRKST